VTVVVIDASAGVEIILDTHRGRALATLIPGGSEAWVPEHFIVEVLGGLRRQLLIEKMITDAQASTGRNRLRNWHLRRAAVRALGDDAWGYRHNIAMADAVYVALTDHLGAALLTDDHKLVSAPTFPRHINVLSLPKPASS
jgi:predicted nucleic acid-binding protein